MCHQVILFLINEAISIPVFGNKLQTHHMMLQLFFMKVNEMGRDIKDGSRVEGPQAPLFPQTQLDNYQIIKKINKQQQQQKPAISLNTDRTNSTPKRREETILKKVGSVGMWFRRERY